MGNPDMGLTLKQASKALGMTEDEVMELVSAGKLKAERTGNRLKIDESEIEAVRVSPAGSFVQSVPGVFGDGHGRNRWYPEPN